MVRSHRAPILGAFCGVAPRWFAGRKLTAQNPGAPQDETTAQGTVGFWGSGFVGLGLGSGCGGSGVRVLGFRGFGFGVWGSGVRGLGLKGLGLGMCGSRDLGSGDPKIRGCRGGSGIQGPGNAGMWESWNPQIRESENPGFRDPRIQESGEKEDDETRCQRHQALRVKGGLPLLL